jgi:high-affinity iron transporter
VASVIAAFVILLREGLEAALIVGIVAAYLIKIGRRDALRPVALGVAAAIALSVTIGVLIFATIGRLPLALKEPMEGLAALIAVAVLTWMIFWMRRQGRLIKGELETQADIALASGSTRALVGLAFVAVLREGVETALFLLALLSSAASTANTLVIEALVGAVLGLFAAVVVGWLFFRGALRLDLRRFFTITGVLIIFVAAGLMSFAVAEFTEGGLLPVTPVVFDLGGVLPETSVLGALLAGLFGYRSQPTTLEVAAYLLYLLPVLTLFLYGDRLRARLVPSAATAGAVVVLAVALTGCSGAATGSQPPGSAAPGAGTVAVTTTEFAFTPSTLTVPGGSVSFEVSNSGTIEHEFELMQGDTVIDEIEGLVPGLTQTLTVDLAAGAYEYVCRLAGHLEAGMKGALTVTE